MSDPDTDRLGAGLRPGAEPDMLDVFDALDAIDALRPEVEPIPERASAVAAAWQQAQATAEPIPVDWSRWLADARRGVVDAAEAYVHARRYWDDAADRYEVLVDALDTLARLKASIFDSGVTSATQGNTTELQTHG